MIFANMKTRTIGGIIAVILFGCTNLALCLDSLVDYQPQQIHLAYGDNSFDIVVTWSTIHDTLDTWVEYGTSDTDLAFRTSGASKIFVDGGKAARSQFIHKVTLSGLQASTRYFYHCGSDLGWSAQFWFVTGTNKSTTPITVAIYGDLGNKEAASMGTLQLETQRRMYDAIMHIGDFAYDFHHDDGLLGDAFMRQIESIAAYVPYMVCAGNHEQTFNFSHYRARFNMPGNTESITYSFNMGPVHFIGFSSEVYAFYEKYGTAQIHNQYEWLERDLIEANKPENRAKRPWIITLGHRPMYCSNLNTEKDCMLKETAIRNGLPGSHGVGLEDLFYKYTVDVEIWAHEHSYERLWPIYDYQVYNGSYDAPYTNPGAPVHLITGSPGNREGREKFGATPDWSAFHSQDFGYTRMTAFNGTHLYFEQISIEQNGAVIDSFYIIKDHHTPYLDALEPPKETIFI